MPTRTRLSSAVTFLLGALTVGVVVLALAVAGVFGSGDNGSTTSTATSPAPTASISTGARPTDVAVLKIDAGAMPNDAKPLTLGDSSNLRPGVPAIAIGSPFGLEGTVTTGIVSALDRKIESPNGFEISGVVQTDAAINPGNSGGPLLDGEGRVIGINSQIATGGNSNANSGVGFAVPVNTVKQVVPKLQANGKDRPRLARRRHAGDPDRRRRRGCAGQSGRPRGRRRPPVGRPDRVPRRARRAHAERPRPDRPVQEAGRVRQARG